jgi:hypothetical protein
MSSKVKKTAERGTLTVLNEFSNSLSNLSTQIGVIQTVGSKSYLTFPAGKNLLLSLTRRESGTGINKGLNHSNIFCTATMLEDVRGIIDMVSMCVEFETSAGKH